MYLSFFKYAASEKMAIPFWQVKDFMNEPSFHEQMTKKEAEKKLKEQGSRRKCYLTRYSETNKTYRLSVMYGRGKNKFEHYGISKTKYALVDSDKVLNTLSEMLEYYRRNRISNTLRNIGVPVVYSKYKNSECFGCYMVFACTESQNNDKSSIFMIDFPTFLQIQGFLLVALMVSM